MPRPRSPVREKAKEMWLDSSGEILLKDIAAVLGKTDSQIRKWKNQDQWDLKLNGNIPDTNSGVTKYRDSNQDFKVESIFDENKRPGFLTRISSLYEKLKGIEQKIADYVQSHSEEIVHLTITEVADRCNSSESSIVRFCQHIGYKGFQDFKINIAKDTMSVGKQIHQVIEEDDDLETINRKVFLASIQALYDSLEVIKSSELERAVDLISQAKYIEIYGTGASGPVALDAQHKFLKIGIKAFAYIDVFLQSMSASVLERGDVVIAISHSGTNLDILHALQLAKQQGATVICITNFAKSPITNIADVVLYTAAPETKFRTDATASRISQLAIIDSLFTGVALKNPQTAHEKLMKTINSTVHKRK